MILKLLVRADICAHGLLVVPFDHIRAQVFTKFLSLGGLLYHHIREHHCGHSLTEVHIICLINNPFFV